MRSVILRLAAAWLLLAAATAQADFSVHMDSGDQLDVETLNPEGSGPLFVWLINQYAEMQGPDQLAEVLIERDAVIWRVDLLETLLLQRTNEAVRSLGGTPVAALLDEAVDRGHGPIVLVTCDRMSVPLLRGMRTWQARAEDATAVAGAVLFFPNLYRGTPVAGEDPEFMGIVSATSMPVIVMQPELGTNRRRLESLLSTLHLGGSPAFGWMIDGVRDYYLLHEDEPQSESLEAMGPVPEAVRMAKDTTPDQLLAAARLLAKVPRPDDPPPLDSAAEEPIAPPYGLVERPPEPAPEYRLPDARGPVHDASENLGRVTLVNFWATWCPSCVHEIPSMNRLQAGYDEDDFAIVSFNYKEDQEHVLDFMAQIPVDFPVLLDIDGAVSDRWDVFAFPSSFILDAEGRIRYSVNTAIEWDTEEVRAVIDTLLRERED
ncbi:MAG: TlpA family protein disulfide reductase [Halothiobacillaceae bacterium]